MNFLRCFAAWLAVLMPLHVLSAADPPEVELITDSEFLQPTSTLEVRFVRPVIARDEIGVAASQSPLVFEPPLPGKFTWLSTQSGVFVPDGAPPLGTEFTVSLAPGWKPATGAPLGKTFRAKLRTPPFQITHVRGGISPDAEAEPMPQVGIALNLSVHLADAEKLARFISANGGTIAAQARRMDFRLPPEAEDWEERWKQSRNPASADEAGEDEPEEESRKAKQNRVIFEPAEPLQPGLAWRFELAPGLKAQSGAHALAKPLVVTLGTVKPFQLLTVTPAAYINSGRSLTLEFSAPLAPDINEAQLPKHFRVEPPVTNLRLEEGWTTLVIRGDFELGKEYTLHVADTVISASGLPLDGERVRTFQFAPVKPRLYLPEITAHQIRGGNRKFEVLSANLRALRVTARLVEPGDVAKAITAFQKYQREEAGEEGEEYQPLPQGAITGKVISDRVAAVAAGPLDAPQKVILDWDEILGAQKAGAIFLTIEGEPLEEVGGRRSGAQALIQLTDLGVLWKKAEEELRVTIFSLATGQPLPGARVALLNSKLAETANGSASPEGVAQLPVGEDPAWLVVQHGDDFHALPMGPTAQELPMYGFNLPIYYRSWNPQPDELSPGRGMLFTDRPLYRPGELVRVKGILRRIGELGLETDANRDGVLTLSDPRGRKISETTVRTDERGAFDAALQLGTGSTGGHYVAFRFSEKQHSDYACPFEVADYQPNAFELDVAIPEQLPPAAEVRAEVSARYLFGAPLTSAKVQWTLSYGRTGFRPQGFGGFQFCGADRSEESRLTLRGDASLAGPAIIRPMLPDVKGAPAEGALTVEVTDINQQTVSETRIFTRDASDFYLGIASLESSVVRAGEAFEARVIAVQPNGEPLPKPAPVTAELIRMRHETVRVQGAGKAISFRTETHEELVEKSSGETLLPKREDDGWKVEGATARFTPEAAGEYRLRVATKDAGGREVVSECRVYVSGPDELAWDYRNPAQVDLVADKPEYQAGDTARILIKTPIAGDALITVERGEHILRTMQVRLEGNAPTIEVPIEAADAPNVFVSMVLVRGAEQSTRKFKTPEHRYGVCMLRVADPVTRLQVQLAPARAEVQPGDEVVTSVTVRDGLGAPVADAEVTFFAADDGVLALTGYKRPMPGEVFEAPLPLQVRTGLSLFDLLPEDPADLVFSNKGYLIGGGGVHGRSVQLRNDFPGTACWFPALRTDKDGRVQVRFRAPDAITRYRLVAVAHARFNLFGSAESAFAIRKPLMLMPAVGQFANVGDELSARAVVRNDTGSDGTVEVALVLNATARSPQPAFARLAVKNGETKQVDFPVQFQEMGVADWRWSARMEAGGAVFEDYVSSTLPVGSPSLLLRETYLADVREASADLLAGVNPQLLEGTGEVEVTVSNTRLSSLRESVAYLRRYPYGCLEQTVSGLAPFLVSNQLRPVMPEIDAATEAEEIARGVEKIFSMQTSGGGLGFWPGANEPSLFGSAYAAVALSLLEKRQIPLPESAGPLFDYLSAELRNLAKIRVEWMLGDRALAMYALALVGRPEPAYHEELFRRRAELSRETRAVLALAVLESGGPAAMVAELLNPKKTAPESFSFFSLGSRERAMQLMAWSRFQPRSPEIARLVKELSGLRRNGHWGTTQDNAWALLALARYYTAVEGGARAVQGTLLAAGKEVPFRVTKEQPALTHTVAYSPAKPPQPLSVQNPGRGVLFTEARFAARPPLAQQPRQDRGYSVGRSYRKIAEDGALREAADMKVGDRVLVTLRIETVRPGHFVAIDDPLPSIFEAVNPSFQTRAVGGGGELERDWISDHREMRADRVLIFCDSLPAGTFTFRYLARVRSAGTATAPATKVEQMYRPERFGLGETVQLTSRIAE